MRIAAFFIFAFVGAALVLSALHDKLGAWGALWAAFSPPQQTQLSGNPGLPTGTGTAVVLAPLPSLPGLPTGVE